MPFISVRNCKDLLDQVSCSWDNTVVPRCTTYKTLKLNVWKKSKESCHISTSFLHLEKSLCLWEMLIDTANINWIQTRNWKAQKNQYLKHCSFTNACKHSPNSIKHFKNNATKQDWWNCFSPETTGCHNPLESGPVPLGTCGKYKYLSKSSDREYVRGFLTVFSHKILHLLFKNLATSVFLIQINTVHWKQLSHYVSLYLSWFCHQNHWTNNANGRLLHRIFASFHSGLLKIHCRNEMLCRASLNYFPMKRPTNVFSITWKKKQRFRFKTNAADSVNKIKADFKWK